MWFNPKLPDAAPRRTKWALTHPLAGRPKPVLGRPAAGGRIRLSSQLAYFFLLPLCPRCPALSMERASVSLKHAQWVVAQLQPWCTGGQWQPCKGSCAALVGMRRTAGFGVQLGRGRLLVSLH